MADLMKIARIAGGDEWLVERVKAACWLHKVNFTQDVLRAIALDPAIMQAVVITDETTINSSAVQASDIERVVLTFAGK